MAEFLKPSRRGLLKGAGSAAAVATLAGPLGLFAARRAEAANTIGASPYGAVSPAIDLETGLPLLQLPPGFSYRSMSWTGDMMTNGKPVHERHDGMACFAVGSGRNQQLVLIRNHESSVNPVFGLMNAPGQYDTDPIPGLGHASGGTSNIYLQRGRYVETRPSLGGTVVNCAGGPTPWDSWLSCEETVDVHPVTGTPHGFVFEVSTDPTQTTGNPIRDMGRMRHEATATDPATGFVYLTEDASGRSGFYKFEPEVPLGGFGSLEQGGALYMAKVQGMNHADLSTPSIGDSYHLTWVRVAEPAEAPTDIDEAGVNGTVSGPFAQGWVMGGMRMRRGEGIWYSTVDRVFYVVDTSAAGQGALWAFDPAASTFSCVYASTAEIAGNNADNVTVSPRGGVLMCEDGGGVEDQFGFGERLLGLLPNGLAYPFAKNNIQLSPSDLRAAGKSELLAGDHRGREWCGACFSPDGRTLFVNIQTPGITFAITGPWRHGNL